MATDSKEKDQVETTDEVEETEATPEQAILSETRERLEAQLEELRPQAEAFHRVEQVLANFDQITSGRAVRRGTRRGTSSSDRAPRGSRLEEFVQIVKDSGEEGITVTEAAEKAEGVNKNYLYRLANDAVDEGLIQKVGKKYVAAAVPAA